MWIPDGDAGTLATLAHMRDLVRAQYAEWPVRDRAMLAIRDAGTDPLAQLLAIRAWLASVLRFTNDPRNTEALHTPVRLLELIDRYGALAADCDDVAILGAALAASIGFPVRFVAVALDKDGPYEHVWAEAASPTGIGEVVEFDVTRPWQQLPDGLVKRPLLYPVIL